MTTQAPPFAASVHTVKKKLSDGSVAIYRYHRKTRKRLYLEPHSEHFVDELRRAGRRGPGDRKPRRSAENGSVYFVLATVSRLIKIGYASDLKKRFQVLRSASPEPLELLGSVAGAPALEVEIHGRVCHLRRHGEWFMDAPELRALIP